MCNMCVYYYLVVCCVVLVMLRRIIFWIWFDLLGHCSTFCSLQNGSVDSWLSTHHKQARKTTTQIHTNNLYRNVLFQFQFSYSFLVLLTSKLVWSCTLCMSHSASLTWTMYKYKGNMAATCLSFPIVSWLWSEWSDLTSLWLMSESVGHHHVRGNIA